MNRLELLPLVNSPKELIEALGRAEQNDRRDLLPEVEILTEHDDPLVREQALSLLLSRWKHVPARWRALRALGEDMDFGVRAQAAFSLLNVATPETRKEDVRAVLDRFLDEDEDMDARRSYYEALLTFHGRRDIPHRRRGLDLVKDIDWPWIQQLREEHDM